MRERESDTYRRGLTLGLTMAEVFILILFLLLLVLLALYAFNAETEKKLQGVEGQLEKTQTKLAETEKKLEDKKETATQLRAELIAIKNDLAKARRSIPKDIQRIIRDNELLKKGMKEVEKENATIAEKLKAVEDQQAQTERELNAMKDVRAVIYDNQRPEESLADTAERLQNTYQKNDKIREENARLRAELSDEKGIDPPCWYQVTRRQGERHEKPYFLMDVAVHDEYLEIRMQKAPPGRAIDERNQPAITSYREEYKKLPLPPFDIIERVSLQQFTEITEPIKRMGKNKQIRDYACVFYVKVWDFTPATAKTRWKEAEDVIKQSFYTLRIIKDPW